MAPITKIEAIDPELVNWQDWKKGGGNVDEPIIKNTFEQALASIQETGATEISFSGVDPTFGSSINEAKSWASTLRRKFKGVGLSITLVTEDVGNNESKLSIKLK